MSKNLVPPLAALTSVFTPPCSTTWLLTTTRVPSQCPPFPTNGPSACDPPSWDRYLASCGFEYYSPAICPSGFSIGPSCEITNPRTAQDFPAIEAGETAAYCVPSGHTCTSDTSDFRGGVWGVLRTASANGAAATVGPAIQIRWREEDLSLLETDPLTPGLSTPETTTTVIQVPSLSLSHATTTATSVSETLILSLMAEDTSHPSIEPQIPSSTFSASTPAISTSVTTSAARKDPTITTTSLGQPSTLASSAVGSTSEENERAGVSSFSLAAVVLTGILIAIIQGYAIFMFIRRYRQYRAGKVDSLFPLEVGVWLRQCVGRGRQRNAKHPEEESPRPKNPDAELGIDGPLPELGPGDVLGTDSNPAELGSNPERWSWMPRVSKMLTVRLGRDSLGP
ncbi:Uu.00g107520.m01.CDS01 [Anthostomella pinea]|uniref:Uu.00g107520.m01.CDS01 n=1 Tax=Anthostomella pinea TaxID=933095 RepID=A0AAI8YFW8_9PEZI|nr:Uu.00g107520.m01.CDS01 [Anthostomella pinea]